MIHLRQICLVAGELAPVIDTLEAVLGIERCYVDPGVGVFGLENTLLPVGTNFLEVVAPVQDGTAAGRYLQRRRGDGGYMVICQADSAATQEGCRSRAAAQQVRVAWEREHDGYHIMQLHPGDLRQRPAGTPPRDRPQGLSCPSSLTPAGEVPDRVRDLVRGLRARAGPCVAASLRPRHMLRWSRRLSRRIQMDASAPPRATAAELHAALPHILAAPKDGGRLDMIVSRPGPGERRLPHRARLTAAEGVEGDHWSKGCWRTLEDGTPHPDVQICLMMSRMIRAIAGEEANWPPAGDNLFVDMDLTPANTPPGTRLGLGTVEMVVTPEPHNGCQAFIDRYGRDACVFVNTGPGREHRLRGIYCRVTRDGEVSVGDALRTLC